MRRLTSQVSPVDADDGGQFSLQHHDFEAEDHTWDMWVMPTCEYVRLSMLRSHEELRAEGKVVRVDRSMVRIFYISHEWTSLQHPDHSMSQLRTFQLVLLRMLRGDLPDISPIFSDAVRLPRNVSIVSSQWQTLVQDSFVWMDCISVRSLFASRKFESVVIAVTFT